MSRAVTIFYPRELLELEITRIRESILKAMRPVFEEAQRMRLQALGVQLGDPEIFAQYRCSKARSGSAPSALRLIGSMNLW